MQAHQRTVAGDIGMQRRYVTIKVTDDTTVNLQELRNDPRAWGDQYTIVLFCSNAIYFVMCKILLNSSDTPTRGLEKAPSRPPTPS